MWYILLLLFAGACVGIGKFIWPHKITWQEWALAVIVSALLGWAVTYAGTYSSMRDIEIWNGHITKKYQEDVSCEHSYQCNCRMVSSCSGTGSNRSCTSSQVCDTCYEHYEDYDWVVETTVGRFTVARVDRQGTATPQRWTDVTIGDPASREHSYDNYLKAVPDSVFLEKVGSADRFLPLVPDYPRVYDYHRVNRVLWAPQSDGSASPPETTLSEINQGLAHVLRELGPKRQMNVVAVFTDIPNEAFAYAVRAKWLGGKKNDVLIIVGMSGWPKIGWVHVHSWSKQDIFNVKLRDALLASRAIDPVAFVTAVTETSPDFQRRSMEELAYLADEIEPPLWVLILAGIAVALSSLGLSYFFYREDVCLGRLFRGR